MPPSPDQSLKFFVYIVESPSAPDIYHSRSESSLLEKAICLNDMPCVARCAISREAFEAALRLGLREEMDRHDDRTPILHISAHGNQFGIELANKEVVPWNELRELLVPINRALNGALLVCMSSCNGFAASSMALTSPTNETPFFALVGTTEKPTWSETAVAYAAFYHLVTSGHYFRDAVDAMSIASGHPSFIIKTTEEVRQGFLELLQRVNTQEALKRLDTTSQQVPGPHLAKLRSLENVPPISAPPCARP